MAYSTGLFESLWESSSRLQMMLNTKLHEKKLMDSSAKEEKAADERGGMTEQIQGVFLPLHPHSGSFIPAGCGVRTQQLHVALRWQRRHHCSRLGGLDFTVTNRLRNAADVTLAAVSHTVYWNTTTE